MDRRIKSEVIFTLALRIGDDMYRILTLCLCLILCPAVMVMAQDEEIAGKTKTEKTEPKEADTKETGTKKSGAKELSGMSIVGNDEAPKSLYIVPWKSSELGVEAGLTMFLNEGDVPVDRDVFKRQLDFYQISTAE